MKITLLIPCLLMLFSCVTSVGTKFSWEDTKKLNYDMSEQDAISILGKPDNEDRTTVRNTSILTWSYVAMNPGSPDIRSISCGFTGGKLTMIVSNNGSVSSVKRKP